MSQVFFIFIAFGLVLLNAFFVAAEFGMVKLRTTRVAILRKKYGIRGKILAQIHHSLDAYLSACQLGITLASLGLGWVGEPAFAYLIKPLLTTIGIDTPELITVISFLIAFTVLSFLHIVVGELMPKSLAIRQSERISMWTAIPLYCFYWLMYPAIWALNSCSNFLLRLTNLDSVQKGDASFSTEEIKLILSSSHLYGHLTKQETNILKHTVDFADLKVTDVMRPVEEMVSITLEDSMEDILKLIMEYRYSRYPVYSRDEETIVGIVHVKDLFAASHANELNDLTSIMRPILKVSRRLPALKLLNKFRKGMPHFALVYASKDHPFGFVTLDHLFRILVGRIRDEFHKTQEDWVVDADGSFIMNGSAPLYVIERALDIEIESQTVELENIDTITGLLLHHLDRLPKIHETVEFEQFIVVIKEMKAHRILKVAIYSKNSPSSTD